MIFAGPAGLVVAGLDDHGVVRALAKTGDMPAILKAFAEGRPLPDA